MKRIVTGHDRSGKSIFVSEGEPPKQVTHAAGGLQITEIWGTDEVPVIPAPTEDPTTVRHRYFPDPGGTRFVLVRFPPAAEAERAAARAVDAVAATKEFFDHFPGLGDLMGRPRGNARFADGRLPARCLRRDRPRARRRSDPAAESG
jgi:hypothetical protein